MKIKNYFFLTLLCILALTTSAVAERNWYGTQDQITTSAAGTTYVPLSTNGVGTNYLGDWVTIYNTTTAVLRVQRVNNTNSFLTLQTNMAQTFKIEANVSELQVRRDDGSATTVTVPFEVIRSFVRGGTP